MNYNDKYKFISDGTYFKEGTEVKCESLWRMNVLQNDEYAWDLQNPNEGKQMSYEFLIENKQNIHGIFRGIWVVENPEYYPQLVVSGRIDENNECYGKSDLCGLDEFEIIKR